jgi:hypothetical protein
MNPSDDERELDEYRRASAEDAGRPPAAVRKAILDEAAAAARRRTPAANESRYLWRGLAGVAVLGFAILMWRQVDHRLPGDAPVVKTQSAPAVLRQESAPPAPAAEQRLEPARALGKMSAAQDAAVDAEALLRLHFPQQYQSDTPHAVWLVQDASGAVLRSGELAAGQTLGEIRPGIERELGTLLRPWRIRNLQNARGQTIELGIAQTP